MSSQLDPRAQVGHSVLGYPSRLLSRTEVAGNTVAFQFQRPSNFLFRPGQFMDLTLRGPAKGLTSLTHTFSIASSCFASDILVATRMRDSVFKRALSALPLGTEVSIRGPMGAFVLHSDASRPAVFLAGGIGIAPFLSMLSSAAIDKTHPPIFLSYSNRHIEDAAFMDALWDLEMSNQNFHFSQRLPASRQVIVDGKGQPALLARRCCPKASVICRIRSITLPGRQAWSQGLIRCWLNSPSSKKTFGSSIL